jgi:hypothetical protein
MMRSLWWPNVSPDAPRPRRRHPRTNTNASYRVSDADYGRGRLQVPGVLWHAVDAVAATVATGRTRLARTLAASQRKSVGQSLALTQDLGFTAVVGGTALAFATLAVGSAAGLAHRFAANIGTATEYCYRRCSPRQPSHSRHRCVQISEGSGLRQIPQPANCPGDRQEPSARLTLLLDGTATHRNRLGGGCHRQPGNQGEAGQHEASCTSGCS